MRINGNLFNFMNSSFFSSSSMVSRLFGNRNVGSMNMPGRNRVNPYSQTYIKDGVLYHRGNRTESRLYTRQGTLVGARPRRYPSQRRPFYSAREILGAIEKYDGYMLGYDGRAVYFQGMKNIHSNSKTSRYSVESHPAGERMYFNPADVNAALGIHNPKQMSVKDNEVRFDDNSCYQFTGKDGKSHTVLSASGLLSADVFGRKGTIDEEAAEYADFWQRLAHSIVPHAKYSQDEIRNKLAEAGIQNGFFTVSVGNHSHTYFLSQEEDAVAVRTKEAYDKRYNELTSGKAFEPDNFQPGQTVSVGGKDYVLKDDKSIDIEYGAELY